MLALLSLSELIAEGQGLSAPEWEQLVRVAVADANLLPCERGEDEVLEGVCGTVLDAYRLARYKVHNYMGEIVEGFNRE